MVRFTKMHGAGNDFVFLDALGEPSLADRGDLPALARAMCDRRKGVGADGLIVIAAPRNGSGAAVRMDMYNTDGSASAMCGNGLRCLVKYVLDRNLVREGAGGALEVETGAGIVAATSRRRGGAVESVTVDMGRPVLDLARVPVDRARLAGGTGPSYAVAVGAARLDAVFVSMGNPHAAIYVDDVAGCDVAGLGPRLEHHPAFPQRMNVHFVQVAGPGEVIVRHWERGCGMTGACGSGACAVCVAGVLTGRSGRRLLARLPGGDVSLHWEPESEHVLMTGGAVEVFEGTWRGGDGAR
jgi:diaminopimelate epimerase